MDNNTRRMRFEARVTLEREFLTRVNSAFCGNPPLAGMTAYAIESWRERARTSWPAVKIDRIARILFEASSRADLVADNSKEVFEPEHRPSPDSLNEVLNLLDDVLRER